MTVEEARDAEIAEEDNEEDEVDEEGAAKEEEEEEEVLALPCCEVLLSRVKNEEMSFSLMPPLLVVLPCALLLLLPCELVSTPFSPPATEEEEAEEDEDDEGPSPTVTVTSLVGSVEPPVELRGVVCVA